jgi:hypothetical protein
LCSMLPCRLICAIDRMCADAEARCVALAVCCHWCPCIAVGNTTRRGRGDDLEFEQSGLVGPKAQNWLFSIAFLGTSDGVNRRRSWQRRTSSRRKTTCQGTAATTLDTRGSDAASCRWHGLELT